MAFLPGKCLLHNLLRERKLSQRELADKVKMPPQQISNYANGESRMSLASAKTIAHALGVTIDDLYEWIVVTPYRGKGKDE